MPNFGSDSIQIVLNSKYASRRISGSNSNVVFSFPSFNVEQNHHLHISLINAVIPYSFYTINYSNNMLMYIINNQVYTLMIEPGNYSVIQLASYLNEKLVGIKCTYNSIRNKYTFTAPYDFMFNSVSSALRMMGVVGNYESVNRTLESSNCINLQTIQYINLRTNFMTGNFSCNNLLGQNILCSIPVNNSIPNGNVVYDHHGDDFTIDLYTKVLREFHIMICDQDDNILDLNGCDWSVVIQIDIVDFVNEINV